MATRKKITKKSAAKKRAAKKATAKKATAKKATPVRRPAPPPSRFVWLDLMSTNPMGAMAFYAEVLGHAVRDIDMGSFTYHQLAASGKDIGGIVPFDAEHGWPSHWVPYIEVADVDALCEQAKALGGSVSVPPFDIPGVGRTAVVNDPAGAIFSPIAFVGDGMPASEGEPEPGQVSWMELSTTDLDGAAAFYAQLLGWTTTDMDMGAMGPYKVFRAGELSVGGAMTKPEGSPGRSAWLTYFVSPDVDGAVAKAKERGATLLAEPFDVPDIGRMALLIDPWGAAFAVHRV